MLCELRTAVRRRGATTLTLTIQLQNDFMAPIINDYGKSPLGMHGQASGGASGGGGAAAAPR